MSYRETEALKRHWPPSKGRVEASEDFLNTIWKDRPDLPMNPVYLLSEKYSGRSAKEKIAWLRETIHQTNCSHILLNGLDQIAWLFNIRSHDVPFNPVAISYALVSMDEAVFFITPGKTTERVVKQLQEQGVVLAPYASLPPCSTKSCTGQYRYDRWQHTKLHHIYTINTTLGSRQRTRHSLPVILEKAIKTQWK